MAIGHDNSTAAFASGSWGTGTSFVWSHAINDPTNGALTVAVFQYSASTDPVTSITFGATALNPIQFKATTTPIGLSVYGKQGLSGTANITVSVSPSSPLTNCMGDSWTGLDQTTPFGTPGVGNSTASPAAASATLPSGGAVAGFFIEQYTTVWTPGQTQLQQSGSVNSTKGRTMAVNWSTSTGSMTCTTDGGFPWAAIAVPLNPPAAPAITQQPAQQTVYAGQTATFNISATTSGGTLHYQWKKNGSNVGTDSSSYTTPATTISDNLSIYTCVVTDDNGSTTSAGAYLVVLGSATTAWWKA